MPPLRVNVTGVLVAVADGVDAGVDGVVVATEAQAPRTKSTITVEMLVRTNLVTLI